MNQVLAKTKAIYVPFLLISVGFLVLYSLLHWLLIFRMGLATIDEDLLNFWLPLILPIVPISVWLRPQLRGLVFKKTAHQVDYFMVAAVVVAGPTIIAQVYLVTAVGKLTHLDRISQIQSAPVTRYYSVDNFFCDKSRAGLNVTVSSNGRSPTLTVKAFFVSPLRDRADNLIRSTDDVWIGINYQTEISNRIFDSTEQKNQQYKAFVEDSVSKFNKLDLHSFSYMARLGPCADRRAFLEGVKNSSGSSLFPLPIIIVPQAGSFDARAGYELPWVFSTFGIGAAIWFVMLLLPRFDETRIHLRSRGRASRRESSDSKWKVFLPQPGFYFTPIVSAVNIVVFLFIVLQTRAFVSFSAMDLLAWGANYGPLVRQGQWFRLVTSMFLHAGIMHLFLNLYGLLLVGMLLEHVIGTIKFASAYTLTGIAASTVSILSHAQTVSCGASGAIFGMYGVLLVFSMRRIADATPPVLSLGIFIGLNLLMGWISPGVDNAAHVGGFLAGTLMGLMLNRFDVRTKQAQQRNL